MRLISLLLLAIGFTAPLSGEAAFKSPAASTLAPSQIVRNSGLIFSGTVVKVERPTSAGPQVITQITFRVESAIRGTRRGQTLTIREWGGLWNSGERYQTGERVFLFLYPQSKLGLTSPVGGLGGRYRIDQSGHVLLKGVAGAPKPVRLSDFSAAIRRAAGE